MDTHSINKKKVFATLTVTFLLLSMFLVIPGVIAPAALEVTVDNNTASEMSNYNFTLTTQVSEVITYISIDLPRGFDLSSAQLLGLINLGNGYFSHSENLLVFQPNSPQFIPAGKTISIQVGGVVNIAASGTYVANASILNDNYEEEVSYSSYPFKINPQLTISPSYGGVKTDVHLTGLYFQPSETVTLTFNNTVIETLTTNSSGGFTTTYTVNVDGFDDTMNCYFNASDADGYFAAAEFSMGPLSVVVTPHRGGVLLPVGVFGENFSPNSPVSVVWDQGLPSEIQLNNTTTDAEGYFFVTFAAPNGRVGFHNVTAADGDGHTVVATYRIDPPYLLIELGDDAGFKGFNFTITGVNFTPNSTATLLWDNFTTNTTLGSVAVLANGTFTKTLTVPTAAIAGYNLIFALTSDNKSASTEYEVLDSPSIMFNPRYGNVGSSFIAFGGNFTANSALTLTWNGMTIGNKTTDALGNFNGTLTVPATPYGYYWVNASDALGNKASRLFLVEPTLTVSAVNGSAGKVVTVTGTGWNASIPASLHLSFEEGLGMKVADMTTDANGSFTVSFTVPAILHTWYYVDVSYDGLDFVQYDYEHFTVLPGIILSPSSGVVTTVAGTSFEPYASVTIYRDGIIIATATVDANGNFTSALSFSNTAATYNITATDPSGNRASATFTVPDNTGAKGEVGKDGASGSSGSNGATGATGEQGEQGETGDTGETGPSASPIPSSTSNTGFNTTELATYILVALALVIALVAVLLLLHKK